jgi:hypothetical protein
VSAADRCRVSCAESRITKQSIQLARDLAEMISGCGTANHPAQGNCTNADVVDR